ncbi:maleylpyruvate isomerase N-terminal domain-containing protein [Mycobacterium sp. CVI_P3]|uniref:Maleylpyruvate isomerase N-terminal domain-containing protein n=1 Tax=Mycobacterium pinniadriaticum TaxID=2994102 RepID=A0ABT3S718_9MYCO|nr:maleylpyruvate isomerase N-terminal domain-containing protein [Mycobacterium pinniadriaticum]MCX2928849.1 maleylpyruvate isomerase N-terminal domain-containing protein [Mycobacterium pinniadriaticum]MCX2935284.1 maleylpyruvate isomerase N-terminal domain-containing protein [Mycobacterium pinniadriaticum]
MSGVTSDRRAAFKAERADMLAFCAGLDPAEWRMDSRAAGWRIQDVVAHLGAGCRAPFSPLAAKFMRGNDIEVANDLMVDTRRNWSAADVLAEYRRWSGVAAVVFPLLAASPLARVQMPLAELGRFPVRLLPSAMVFDHHTHLRHDMAPALGRPAPVTDANRMTVVLEWMMAVLSNQMRAATPAWLDHPLAITLAGPGGGSWRVGPDGSVAPGSADGSAAQIDGLALEFPEWGTRRAGWRDRDVRISGDADYATAFLDTVNVV